MPRTPASVLGTLLAVSAAMLLSACSITITANQAPSDEASVAASSSAEATPDPSKSAVIDQAFQDFCVEEATGALDFISMLEPAEANDAISDGIAQSIANQQMDGPQSEACTQAWVDTMAANGITYDPAAASASATP